MKHKVVSFINIHQQMSPLYMAVSFPMCQNLDNVCERYRLRAKGLSENTSSSLS